MKRISKDGGSSSEAHRLMKKLRKLRINGQSVEVVKIKRLKRHFKRNINSPHNTSQYLIHNFQMNWQNNPESNDEIPMGNLSDYLNYFKNEEMYLENNDTIFSRIK